MDKSILEAKIRSLQDALSTVDVQINSLSKFYSYLQVRTWKIRRKIIRNQLAESKQALRVMDSDKGEYHFRPIVK